MNTKLLKRSRLLFLLAVLLPGCAVFFPLWQIMMWAPQYPEGLSMKIWVNNLSGDIRVINALNHYIGMKNIEVEMFPEFKFMIWIILGIVLAGLVLVWINRRWSIYLFLSFLLLTGFAALYDFYAWGYDYGHNLDPEAPIKIPGLTYQPPVIGTKQLLNFTAYSGPDIGGWLFIISGLLVVFILVMEKYFKRTASI